MQLWKRVRRFNLKYDQRRREERRHPEQFRKSRGLIIDLIRSLELRDSTKMLRRTLKWHRRQSEYYGQVKRDIEKVKKDIAGKLNS